MFLSSSAAFVLPFAQLTPAFRCFGKIPLNQANYQRVAVDVDVAVEIGRVAMLFILAIFRLRALPFFGFFFFFVGKTKIECCMEMEMREEEREVEKADKKKKQEEARTR